MATDDSNNIHPIRPGIAFGGGDGSGPEDPMLEKRIVNLEADVKAMKDSLGRLEVGFGRIEEKFSALSTKDDLTRVEMRLGNDMAELKGKVSNLPSTWQIIAILAALLVGIASLVYATDNFLVRVRNAYSDVPHQHG